MRTTLTEDVKTTRAAILRGSLLNTGSQAGRRYRWPYTAADSESGLARIDALTRRYGGRQPGSGADLRLCRLSPVCPTDDDAALAIDTRKVPDGLHSN